MAVSKGEIRRGKRAWGVKEDKCEAGGGWMREKVKSSVVDGCCNGGGHRRGRRWRPTMEGSTGENRLKFGGPTLDRTV